MPTDLDEQVTDFILRITKAMGLKLEAAVEEQPDHVRVNLAGEGADVLLRRKGEPLDALQVIVNTAYGREVRGDRHYVVDALDYRKGKDAELQQMAFYGEVRTTGAASAR
jgi:predicted RNA-binding protein Jag